MSMNATLFLTPDEISRVRQLAADNEGGWLSVLHEVIDQEIADYIKEAYAKGAWVQITGAYVTSVRLWITGTTAV